jgi:hypothetical protein
MGEGRTARAVQEEVGVLPLMVLLLPKDVSC